MKCDAVKFAGMYEEIYRDLYRFALCMMRNPQDAEDVVSEAVIRGFEHVHSLKREDAFKSWMFTILSRMCKKKLAAMAKSQTAHEAEFFERLESGSGEDDMNLSLDVRRAFAVLSDEEQMIVGLSVFGGYQSKEVGEMLKLKSGTVRSKRSRALAKMSVILAPSATDSQAAYY